MGAGEWSYCFRVKGALTMILLCGFVTGQVNVGSMDCLRGFTSGL